MNWSLILIGFALAVFVGSALVALFATIRPQWSPRRKRLTASAILPGLTAVATLLGLLLVATAAHGAQMRDLALAAIATMGGTMTLIAWVGGLLGATLTSRRQAR